MKSTDIITGVVITMFALVSCSFCSDVSLAWNVTVFDDKQAKNAVEGAFGLARRGRLHAIVGPRGSGKTILLNTLAGKLEDGQSLRPSGVVRKLFPGDPVYIQQADQFFAQLTTRETLETTAALSDSRNTTTLLDALIRGLGLEKVQDTVVGDATTRGLSGGECKRLSIGNEVLLKQCSSSDDGNLRMETSYVFADEPTSGLDSFEADRVIALLRGLAERGGTVLVSLHQPRACVQRMFDDITLLSEGGVVYSGPACEMSTFFKSVGYTCPADSSPCEVYVDLVSVDSADAQTAAASREMIRQLQRAFLRYAGAYHAEVMNKVEAQQREAALEALRQRFTNSTRQPVAQLPLLRRLILALRSAVCSSRQALRKFTVLQKRAWRQVLRDQPLHLSRLASSVVSSLLFGSIYFRMENSITTIPDRLGLLQVTAVSTAISALVKAATSFATEKRIVQRERRGGLYPVLPYFLAKVSAEAPVTAMFTCLSGALMYQLCGLNPAPDRLKNFLAILAAEATAASALGMSVGALVPTAEAVLTVFGGLYAVSAPSHLAWVPKMSLIHWAYEALCVNEFSGLPLARAVPDPRASFSPGRHHGLRAQPGWCTELGKLSRVLPGLCLRGATPHLSLPAPIPVPGLPDSAEPQWVKERLGFAQSSVRAAVMALLGITVFNYAFTCAVLMLQRPRSGDDPAHFAGRRFRLAPSDIDLDAAEGSVAGLASSGNATAVGNERAATTRVRDWLEALSAGCRWLLGLAPSQPARSVPGNTDGDGTSSGLCTCADPKRVAQPAHAAPPGGHNRLF